MFRHGQIGSEENEQACAAQEKHSDAVAPIPPEAARAALFMSQLAAMQATCGDAGFSKTTQAKEILHASVSLLLSASPSVF